MDKKFKKDLVRKAVKLSPIIQIGKNGVTESSIDEIKKVLVTRELLKIRILASAYEANAKEEMIKKILAGTASEKVDAIGSILVLYRRKGSRKDTVSGSNV